VAQSEQSSENPRETALGIFRNSIRNGRLAHAYILLGPEGSGKVAFGLEVARTLLCQSGCKPAAPRCPVCKQIASGNHPDVEVLYPRSAGGNVLIGDTREMRRQAYMARFKGRYKIFIMEQADKMTEAAQNQVLKVLEEPPAGTIIFLLAESISGLMETVVSRCAVIRLGGLSEEAVRGRLAEKKDVAPGDAAWAARFSRGSATRAERLLKANARKYNDLMAASILSSESDADLALADCLKEMSAQGEDTQERRVLAVDAIDLLATLLRDALTATLDISSENLYNMFVKAPGGAEGIQALAQLFSTENLLDLLLACADMQRRVGQNLNIDLVCDCLAQEVFSTKAK
jgi:DNA polymerase-3 subunit delta'